MQDDDDLQWENTDDAENAAPGLRISSSWPGLWHLRLALLCWHQY